MVPDHAPLPPERAGRLARRYSPGRSGPPGNATSATSGKMPQTEEVTDGERPLRLWHFPRQPRRELRTPNSARYPALGTLIPLWHFPAWHVRGGARGRPAEAGRSPDHLAWLHLPCKLSVQNGMTGASGFMVPLLRTPHEFRGIRRCWILHLDRKNRSHPSPR
jgi:hypothetical protein